MHPVSAAEPVHPSLSSILPKIEMLTRSWEAEALDAAGTVFLFNAHGRNVPLFWIFNGASELTSLLEVLDSDQPVVGMRSLNQIAGRKIVESGPVLDQLADYYATTLLSRFGTSACIIGGNCNAVEVAYRVAEHLSGASVPVVRFVTLDKDLHLPLPLPVRMIFGRTGRDHPNSTSQSERSRKAGYWRNIFSYHEIVEIPGSHGEYFLPQNVRFLAEAIFMPTPCSSISPEYCSVDWRKSICPDGRLRLELPSETVVGAPDQLDVVPIFKHPGRTRLLFKPLAQLSSPAIIEDGRIVFYIQVPHEDQEWSMLPILCQRGIGPLTWPLERQTPIRYRAGGICAG